MTYVAYREEDSALTMSRVKNNEKPEEGWITSEARVEYVTEGYEDTNMDAALEETRTNQSEADDDYDDDNHDVINDQNKSYEDADMGAQSDTYDDYDDDDGDHEKHAIINFQIKNLIEDADYVGMINRNNGCRRNEYFKMSYPNNPQASKRKSFSILNNPLSNSTREMAPTSQTLANLTNRRAQLSQMTQTHDQQTHGLEVVDRPTEVNRLNRRNHPSNFAKTTPSAPLKRSNSISLSDLLSKHLQKKQCPPAYEEYLPQILGSDRSSITSPTVLSHEKLHQSIENNTVSSVQNLSVSANQPDHIYKQLPGKQSLPSYRVLVEQNSPANRTIITNASGVENNDQRIESKCISTKKSCAQQNFVSNTNRLHQMCKHTEQLFPPLFKDLEQNPHAGNLIVQRTTGAKPLYLANISRNNTNSTSPSAQHLPSIESDFGQLSRAPYQFQTRAGLQNDITHIHQCLAGESTAANIPNQRPGLQDDKHNTSSAVPNLPMNKLMENTENACENQPLPVLKGYLLQDPRTKLLFLVKDIEMNTKENSPGHSVTVNKSPTPYNVPDTTDQSNQSFEDFVPDCFDFELPTHPPCSCVCSHGRRFSSFTPRHATKNPLNSESTVRNHGRQSTYYETLTETRSPNTINLANYQQSCSQADLISVHQNSCSQNRTEIKPIAKSSPVITNQSLKPLIIREEQYPPINVNSSDKVTFTETLPVNKLTSVNSVAESSCLETAESTANLDSSNVINELEDTNAEPKQTLLNDLKFLFSEMHSKFSNTLKSFQNAILTKRHKLRNKRLVSSSCKKMAQPQNTVKSKNVMKCDTSLNHGDKKNTSFVLPPEYNPENSRWTLKYQNSSAGVVEIMPHSSVYVDEKKFIICKLKAKDCKSLARMLLIEIFSDNALRVCSLTGARSNAHKPPQVRPGLDKHARMVLLEFVCEYGQQKGWAKCNAESILNSVRSKVQDIRKKQNEVS
ncbi:uncharacterized protein LOC112048212 isoform X1 [Bicyclus anynana]|uniref:Uncharacterized protein LOC112048212 isoform X1 n=1 Tax=Bicyclus anynana TaxID=110368 RepID=A0ABM3LQP9_BICAN|nr:uncharacterized protein LOC112048212 isoform X1 [Bicyclus anynana]